MVGKQAYRNKYGRVRSVGVYVCVRCFREDLIKMMFSPYREVHSDDECGKKKSRPEPVKKDREKDKGAEKVVQLEPVFFKVGDSIDENAVNRYRMKYREFRSGKAFGARGEIQKPKVLISDAVDTVVPPFIAKLASMLKNQMYAEYVGWKDDGKTVSVKKVSEFSSAILPKYFKHSNFTSFLRQLNMYGFHTSKQGRNWREFKNDLFTRDKPALYTRIKRKANLEKVGSSKNLKGQNGTGKNKKRKKDNGMSDSFQSEVAALKLEMRARNERISKLEARLAALENTMKRLGQGTRGMDPKDMKLSPMQAHFRSPNPSNKRQRRDPNQASPGFHMGMPMLRGHPVHASVSSDENGRVRRAGQPQQIPHYYKHSPPRTVVYMQANPVQTNDDDEGYYKEDQEYEGFTFNH